MCGRGVRGASEYNAAGRTAVVPGSVEAHVPRLPGWMGAAQPGSSDVGAWRARAGAGAYGSVAAARARPWSPRQQD